jgi:hypothetical protein
MAKPGPAPKSAAISKLEGNPSKRPINDEPKAFGQPEKPDCLGEYAAAVWDRVLRSLPPEMFGAVDGEILTAHCQAAASQPPLPIR